MWLSELCTECLAPFLAQLFALLFVIVLCWHGTVHAKGNLGHTVAEKALLGPGRRAVLSPYFKSVGGIPATGRVGCQSPADPLNVNGTDAVAASSVNQHSAGAELWQLRITDLLDISAVFDTVYHVTLLRQREITYGICGPALSSFASWLYDRSLYIRSNTVTS
jgi:hypothetical protein